MADANRGKLIILSAPSGAGKTTIVRALMTAGLNLSFSVSATTRLPRGNEQHGREYYFLSSDEFATLIEKDMLVEFEEVYGGCFYGTLKSEVDRILRSGQHAVFDIDVMGGLHIKQQYGDQALALFIMPPGMEELKERLKGRGTDPDEVVKKRLEKAAWEISFASRFDITIVNDDLDRAITEVTIAVQKFINV